MIFRALVVVLCAMTMILQGAVFSLTAFAEGGAGSGGGTGGGRNLPLITECGVYSYDPASNITPPGPIGEKLTAAPWKITQAPYVFDDNVAIGIKFATNVAVDARFSNNQTVFQLLDASNNSVSIKVDRSGDGTSSDKNRNYLFVAPQGSLKPGSSYRIIIGPTLISNNGMSAGVQQEVGFTTKQGVPALTPAAMTSTTGSAAVGPAAGGPVIPQTETLKDIAGHWAEASIKKLVELNAVSGYPDRSFNPDATITRAEFATILIKAFKLTSQSGKVFDDTSNHWAKDSVATAASYGIASGYEDGTFGPDDLITREQMAVMVVTTAKLAMESSQETSFLDSVHISPWAAGPVSVAVSNGVLNGYPDNTFLPQGQATRAEAVTVIMNVLKLPR